MIYLLQQKSVDKVVELTEYDKPQIVAKMAPYWANDEIVEDVDTHFSYPHISFGIKVDGDLKCFVMMLLVGDDVWVSAIYTDGSMKYKRLMYDMHKRLMFEYKGIKFFYESNFDYFKNHTYTMLDSDGDERKWVETSYTKIEET
jgi:hypothetical protein